MAYHYDIIQVIPRVSHSPTTKALFICLQMVQAIQVLRFHLLELEKVSIIIINLLKTVYIWVRN